MPAFAKRPIGLGLLATQRQAVTCQAARDKVKAR